MTHNTPHNKAGQGSGTSNRSLREQLTWMTGHQANLGTVIYFSLLIGGGGVVVHELIRRIGEG